MDIPRPPHTPHQEMFLAACTAGTLGIASFALGPIISRSIGVEVTAGATAASAIIPLAIATLHYVFRRNG